jgi:hypothetical protein
VNLHLFFRSPNGQFDGPNPVRISLSCARIAVALFGLVILAAAVLAPEIGLGRATDFVPYRLYSVSRTLASHIGVAIALAALTFNAENLSLLRNLVARAPGAIGRLHGQIVQDIAVTTGHRRADVRLLVGEILLALMVALGLFSLNRGNLLGYIDGQYLLTLINNQAEFGTWAPVFSTNPLQGLDDAWYFVNTHWIPEFLAGRAFSDPSTRAVIIQTVAFLEVVLTVSLFAYWLHGSMCKAVASGWLAGMALFPLTYPSLLYNVSPDAPQLAFLTVVPIAMVPLLAALGRGSLMRDAAISGAIVCLAWIYFVGIGLFIALTLPFVAITASVFFVAARHSRNEFICKLAWSAAILVVLFASGLPQILAGLTFDSAAQFSPQDLARAEHVLSDGSLLFRGSEPFGVVLAATGIVGAVYTACFGVGRAQSFGLAVVILAALICLASVLNAYVGFPGAIPIYYEYVLWLVYPIFAVHLLGSLLTVVSNSIYPNSLSIPNQIVERYLTKSAWLTLPLLGLAIMHGPHFARGLSTDRPNIFPPRPSRITEFLRDQIGLSVGSEFKGRVATITGYGYSDTSWPQAFIDDMRLIRAAGNDHRSIGFWYYNIPTLFEFSHMIRPRLYMVAKYLLAKETDTQYRTVLNFRRPSLDLLRLLGVEYLVTDYPAPADDMRRVQNITFSDGYMLAVDKLPDPNLGVSPTKIFVRADRDAFRWLAQDKIDFERTVLLPVEASGVGALTPAPNVTMLVEHGGLRVGASSSGDSLIVLPIQFSHCLRAFANSGTVRPMVLRVDFLLTGLVFHGKLDSTIEYRQGPFTGVSCALNDLREDRNDLQFEPDL